MMDENLFLGNNVLYINCLNPILWGVQKNVRFICVKFFKSDKVRERMKGIDIN